MVQIVSSLKLEMLVITTASISFLFFHPNDTINNYVLYKEYFLVETPRAYLRYSVPQVKNVRYNFLFYIHFHEEN